MMEIAEQLFDNQRDPGYQGEALRDLVLRRCSFRACTLGGAATSPEERLTVRNVELIDCKANKSSLGPVIVEEVHVENLQTGGVCLVWGAAFKHVVVSGRCGTFVLNDLARILDSPGRRAAFRAANEEFYRTVDWALDISQAQFMELDIRNVPADLIRRDPETQVVVRRDQVEATQDVWKNVDLSGTPWAVSLQYVLTSGLKDRVLVAPKRRKEFSRWLAGLRLLRELGIAERD